MGFTDGFFKKVENKTNVNKETILGLAKKLQNSDLQDEEALRDFIKEVGAAAGKEVDPEREDKIVSAIQKDQVPKDIDKML